jgi:hypothetical protein
MVIAGHKLTIIASSECEDEWMLCIENVHHARVKWWGFFESAEDALAEGRRALEVEPIEAFVSTEDLMYLSEADTISPLLEP